LAVFAGAADVIDARPARGLSLEVRGPFAVALGDGTDNLVLRAARALADVAGRSADAALVLHKALPVASGIGGGSADAAATLRGLCRLWDIAPGSVDLPGLALGIGADVPVCLVGRPARIGCIGAAVVRTPAGQSGRGAGDRRGVPPSRPRVQRAGRAARCVAGRGGDGARSGAPAE